VKIKWIVKEASAKYLKQFLKYQGVSKKLLAKVKFKGGNLRVNGFSVRVNTIVRPNDLVTMILPPEEENPNVAISKPKFGIIFEDEHYLIVNKPYNTVSTPSPIHKNETMINQVKGYVVEKDYQHKSIHLVTRLDRDTSGVMVFAKHGYAHSKMDKLLKNKELNKYYIALVNGTMPKKHDIIDLPIRRKEGSIIEREVGTGGKEAQTEYWVESTVKNITKVRVKLLDGRTHQIRVHFSYLGFPLTGDDLYGDKSDYINRQALHCSECSFIHPITGENIKASAPVPEDIKRVIIEKME